MAKAKTLRRYIFKVQAIILVVVLLSYTALLNLYFVRGMDESTYISMYIEVDDFVRKYQSGEQPKLPQTVLSTGYIDWQELPQEIKEHFPSLIKINQLTMKNVKVFNADVVSVLPEKIIFILAHPLKNNSVFYLTRQVDLAAHASQIKSRMLTMLSSTLPIALFFLLLILASVHLILSRLTRPMQRLGGWADELTLENVSQQPIDFGFDELNRVAHQQQMAFKRIAHILEKEHDFLRHASHELRTPIAVVKNNVELLQRTLAQQKSLVSVERIKRASINMEHLIETLLWLTKEDEKIVAKVAVDVSKMILNIVEDNQYLLHGKQTDLSLNLDHLKISLSHTPCRLMINNLVRNAFQYTAEGEINISFINGEIVIENINHVETEIDHTGADYGYGLGLHLVSRIVSKMGWHYQNLAIDGGRMVSIKFCSHQ
jgi:signal transduction histidine kinase